VKQTTVTETKKKESASRRQRQRQWDRLGRQEAWKEGHVTWRNVSLACGMADVPRLVVYTVALTLRLDYCNAAPGDSEWGWRRGQQLTKSFMTSATKPRTKLACWSIHRQHATPMYTSRAAHAVTDRPTNNPYWYRLQCHRPTDHRYVLVLTKTILVLLRHVQSDRNEPNWTKISVTSVFWWF